MPDPNIRASLVRGPLQNVSIMYRNGAYIGDRVFPIVDRVSPKALITTYKKGAFFRDEAELRAPGTAAPEGGFKLGSANVTLKEYAFAQGVTDEDRRDAKVAGAPPVQPEQDAIEYVSGRIDLKKERLVASMVLAGTWSGVAGEDVEGLWAAGAGNTFIDDVEARIETIRKNTGLRPNVLLISASVLPAIKKESSVLDRIKYTERGVVTAALIAAMFELDEVLIGDAIYSDAEEAADGDDFNGVDVWEKNAGKGSAFLFYRPAKAGLKVPMPGIQARGAYEDGKSRRITTWREEKFHRDMYEAAEETHIVQTGADFGFLWYDCIAT